MLIQCIEWFWKIVLLTPAASRGVTDPYPSIRIKKRTRANDFFCERVLTIIRHVGLAHKNKNHIIGEV